MSDRFLRRSLLYVPGSSEKMVKKAETIQADAIIFDLEDAVSIHEKDAARIIVKNAVKGLKSPAKEIIVRINSVESNWGFEDIEAIAPELPDTVILPKADEKSLITTDMLLSALEKKMGVPLNTIKLIPLFETAYAIANAYQVLGATSRINGVQLGAEDLTKEQEIARSTEGKEIRYARMKLAMDARARKIDIIDTPFTGIHDLEGLRRDAEFSRDVGFTGKTCIHPSHIDTINEVFSPLASEVENARGILKAYEQSVAEGKGACMYNNKMVDVPVAERAKKIVEKADKIEKLKGDR